MEEKYIIMKMGQRRLRKTTAGWDLLVHWKDESESWVKLSDMKESHPVEMAEFAKAKGIQGQPAFCWWVPYTLRKRDAIVAAVGARLRKPTHKYGVEIPKDVHHARELDKRNGNSMWMDTLAKEMFNVGIAFEVLEEKQSAPPGWSKVTGHFVWDVKMDFTRKARWVLDGHKTPDPIGSAYAGVVSRESIRIAFTYAMDWTFSQQTFEMHICKHLHPKSIISSAAQNMDVRMKDESLSFIGPYMGENPWERTSAII